MSAENDVPLGDGSRRYYEQQFGDRIRHVKKGGTARGNDNGGGSKPNGRIGCVALFLIVGVLRLIGSVVSHSSTSVPTYTRPHIDLGDLQQPLDPALFAPVDADRAALLIKDDVPLLEGLCYRIHRESLQAEPTPGKHICQLADDHTRKHIAKTADGPEPNAFETQAILDGLNILLRRADFAEGNAFNAVPGFVILQLTRGDDPVRPQFNRSLLEHCYPLQIVPLTERDTLDDRSRHRLWIRALDDLAKARQKYEPEKR